MATVNYITPITNRTHQDVEYAKTHQADLINKNIGAWNYTDMNRICNNLKYAAEHMYEQGFLTEPYPMSIKLDWKETDIITYEKFNSMIVNTMNNLKTYSRVDLAWYPISSIINMDYTLANWLEKNIHALATQVPPPPDKYKLTVNRGSGSGEYEANAVVTITADEPNPNEIFVSWSGDHLENIGNAELPTTTYVMPHQNITLTANYTDLIPHKLTIITYTKTETVDKSMGELQYIEADPAPEGKVFHHWDVNPIRYEQNLYEPAASTHFTMPNEAVTLTAVYISKGEKQLIVENGNGSGWYEYGRYAAVSSNKGVGDVFTNWTGDTQYLTGPVTEEYNSVKIPDVNLIRIRANWMTPPLTNIKLTVENGVIASTGKTEGLFTEGDVVTITSNTPAEGETFYRWTKSGQGVISNTNAATTNITIGRGDVTVTATHRILEYYTLTVTTHSGTTVETKERYERFYIDANPIPEGYVFDRWTGDTSGIITTWVKDDAEMGAGNRTIVANYRPTNTHKLTVKQLSGDSVYEQSEGSVITITAEDAPAGMRFEEWWKDRRR